MHKTLKILMYMFCVCSVLAVFGACKSQPEPQPEPVPVQPVEPEITEDQENAIKLLDELTKVRAQVVEINADKAYPAEFQTADSTADKARQDYEAKNFNRAQEKAQQAILQYRTLINRMHIDSLKAKINKHDLTSYDAENYQKAEELATSIKNLYESDPDAAFKASEEALLCYESVANAGFVALVEDAKKKADEAKERCDSLKAANAMQDAYTKTFTRYRQAGVLIGSQKYEQAYLSYMTAAEEFDDIYEKVKIKRGKASSAMERAKARQEASSQLAKDADREAPLPENVEGFTEEPIEVESLQQSSVRRSSSIPATPSQRQAAGQTPQQNPQSTKEEPELQKSLQQEPSVVPQGAVDSQSLKAPAPSTTSIESIKTSEEASQGTEAVLQSRTPSADSAAGESDEAAGEKASVQTEPAQLITGGQE